MSANRIEVTDLFSSFHEVAQRIWSEPDFRCQNLPLVPAIGDYWYNVAAYLEENLFLAGCARRLFRLTGTSVSIRQVHDSLRICDLSGHTRPAGSGQYHGTGFDWGKPTDEIVPPLVVGHDMAGGRIGEFRLFLEVQADA